MARLRLLTFLPCLALAACAAEGETTILILHNQVPDENCSIPAEDNGVYSPFGVLDLTNNRQEFIFTPLIQSSAVSDNEDPNRRIVIIQGADTELHPGPTQRSKDLVNALGEALRFRRTLTSGNVAPDGGLTASIYTLVDFEQSMALAAGMSAGEQIQVVGSSRVFGEIDGNGVDSPFFNYPITLCIGCLTAPGCFGNQRP